MAFIHPLDKFFEQSSGHNSVDILIKLADVRKANAIKELGIMKRGGDGIDFIRHVGEMFKSINKANEVCISKNGLAKCKLYVDDYTEQMLDDMSKKLEELISCRG